MKRISSELEATLEAYGRAASDAAADGNEERAAQARAVHVAIERFALGAISLDALRQDVARIAPDDPQLEKLLAVLSEYMRSPERAKRQVPMMGRQR